MFLFSRKKRQLLGLDITTSSIKLIELAEPALGRGHFADARLADLGAREGLGADPVARAADPVDGLG